MSQWQESNIDLVKPLSGNVKGQDKGGEDREDVSVTQNDSFWDSSGTTGVHDDSSIILIGWDGVQLGVPGQLTPGIDQLIERGHLHIFPVPIGVGVSHLKQ